MKILVLLIEISSYDIPTVTRDFNQKNQYFHTDFLHRTKVFIKSDALQSYLPWSQESNEIVRLKLKEVQTPSGILKKVRNSSKLLNLLFYTIFIMKYESRKKFFGSWNFQNAQFIGSSGPKTPLFDDIFHRNFDNFSPFLGMTNIFW